MPTLTLDTISQVAQFVEETGPLPQLFAYSVWPDDGQAIVIDHEQGQRIVANPGFWSRIPGAQTGESDPSARAPQTFMGHRIVDLDKEENQQLRHDVMLDLTARLSV